MSAYEYFYIPKKIISVSIESPKRAQAPYTPIVVIAIDYITDLSYRLHRSSARNSIILLTFSTRRTNCPKRVPVYPTHSLHHFFFNSLTGDERDIPY